MSKANNEKRATWHVIDRKNGEVGRQVQEAVWAQFFENKTKKPVQVKRRFKPHPSSVRSESEFSEAISMPHSRSNSDSNTNMELIQKLIGSTPHPHPRVQSSNHTLSSSSFRKTDHNRNEKNNNNNISHLEIESKTNKRDEQLLYNNKNVQVLFERPRLVQEGAAVASGETDNANKSSERSEDKYKTTADVKSKPSRIDTADNIDLKLGGLMPKMVKTVDNIRKQLACEITLPDGEEDYQRRKKRAAEFSSRISRNYLYQLSRETTDLERLLRPNVSCCTTGAHRKFITGYQVIYQALLAFQSHIQNTLPNGVTGKLDELICKSRRFCELHLRALNNSENKYHLKLDDLISNFEMNLQSLQDALESYRAASAVTLLHSNSTKLSLTGSKIEATRKQQNKSKKQQMKNKLSMYSESASFQRDMSWKKISAMFAKKRQGVQSRYKTAAFKHRPPVEKQQDVMVMPPSKNKLHAKYSSGAIQNTPRLPLNLEEKVVTMVEMENEKNKENEEVVTDEVDDYVKSLVQELVIKVAASGKEVSQDRMQRILCDILRLVRNGEKDGVKLERLVALHGLLQGRVGEGECNATRELLRKMEESVVEKDQEELSEKVKQKRRDKKLIIREFGQKNAKLICIKDENSTCEPESETEDNNKNQHEIKKVVRICSQTQTEIIPAIETKNRNVKISRLPKKSLKPVEMLPKEFIFTVAQYKLCLCDYNKGNCLYMKSAMRKPWLLMGKIADNVLETLLLSVAKEMELNDVLENLYQSEFQ